MTRIVIGTFTFLGMCVGFQLLPLSMTLLIQNMAPFSTALLMCYWESISKVDIISMIGASIGIVIVTQQSGGEDSLQLEYQFGTVVMILVAFCFTLIAALSKRLKLVNFAVI